MTVTILHAQDALKALTFSGHFYVPAELLQDTEQSSLIVRIDGVDGTSADPIIHWLLARGGILFQSKNASSGPGSDSLAIMGKRNLFLSLFSDYTPESISVSEVISPVSYTHLTLPTN